MRWAEIAVLFVGVPLVLALLLPPSAMYPVLGAGAVLGAILLHLTAGFRWRSLIGPVFWRPALILTVIAVVAVPWVVVGGCFQAVGRFVGPHIYLSMCSS